MVKFLLSSIMVQKRIDTPIYPPPIYLCLIDDEEYGTVVDEKTRLELIRVLVDAGSSLDRIHVNKQNRTPLMFAAEKGMSTIFNYLLDNGADVNCYPTKYKNILHYLILSDSDMSPQIERVINYSESNSNYKSIVEKNYLMPYILFAVEHEKFKRATRLMGIRPMNVNWKDRMGKNLLHYVALHNSDQSVEFAQSLIGLGIVVDHPDSRGRTPLLTACVNNNINIIRLLLKVRCDVNVKSKFGASALMTAVEREDIELAELLLTYGANANTRNDWSVTVLMKAAECQNVELVKLITRYNADVNFIDHRNENVCEYCFHKQMKGGQKSSFEIVKLIIDLGVDVDQSNYGNRILYAAAGTNDLRSFELLLNSITKLDRVNAKGENIFHILSMVKDFPCSKVQKLFEEFDKLQKEKHKNGCTPLMLASFLLNAGYVDVIKTNGGLCNPDIQNKYGHTALHMCMLGFMVSTDRMGNRGENRFKFRESVKSLLVAGTDVNIQDNNGVTALMMAAMIEDKIMINYCMRFGADITILDYKYGMSALQYLDFKSNCDCLPELLSKDRNSMVNLPGKDGNTLIQRALLFPLFWDPQESVDVICYLCAVNCNLQHLQSVSTERNYFTEDFIDLDDFNIDERDRLRKLLYLCGAPEEEIVLSLNFKRENRADGFSDEGHHSRHLEQFKLFCNNISLQSRCRRVIRQIVGSRLHNCIVASNILHLQDFLFLKQSFGGEADITLDQKHFVTREDQIRDRGGEYEDDGSNGDRPTDVDFDDRDGKYMYGEEDGSNDDRPTDVDFDDRPRGGEYDEGVTDVDFDDVFLSLIDTMYGHVKYINTGPIHGRT